MSPRPANDDMNNLSAMLKSSNEKKRENENLCDDIIGEHVKRMMSRDSKSRDISQEYTGSKRKFLQKSYVKSPKAKSPSSMNESPLHKA